jgi:hypothetical protein
MTEMAVYEEGSPTKEPNWLITCRIVLVIGIGEIAAAIIPGHTNWAYLGGMLLGWALELLVFPRLSWKRNAFVLLIVILAGLLRVALKFTSP